MNLSGSVSQHSVEASIDSLEKEKKNLKSLERYAEANQVSQQIQQLKSKLHQEKIHSLRNSHNSEKEMIEKSCIEEVSVLEQTWESAISSFIQKCEREINTKVLKHSKKLRKTKDRLESEIMNSFRPSAGLLNMIKCKEQAVKQEKLSEAHSLFLQIDQMRSDEELRHMDSRRVAIEQQLANSNLAFDKKLQAMRKRQQRTLDEMNLQKNEEIERVLKKFENLKREVENSQNIRINICEGRHTTSAGRHSMSPEKLNGSTLSPFRQRSLAAKSEM